MNATWQHIQSILESTLAPSTFSLWIKPLKATISGQELALVAPNDFVAGWVRSRLLEQIAQAAWQVMGVTPQITVAAGQAQAETPPAPMNYPTAQSLPLPLPTPLPATVNVHSWRYSFDDFIVGPSNDLAFAAAQAVVRSSSDRQPLYLCSSAGLGKTHLAQAIGQAALESFGKPNLTIRYLTAEEFATRMISALRAGDLSQFKAAFRDGLDLLLLEDVHFLQGKAKIQEELLSTLKALRERGSQVVFTSSFLPHELANIDDHLLSRFSAGMLAVIDKPCMETRVRILNSKADRMRVAVPEEVTTLLAQRVDGDVRRLESCLQNLILKARLLRQDMNLELAHDVLRHFAPVDVSPMERITAQVCAAFQLTDSDLSSKSRKRAVVLARNTAFFLARKHTTLSLKDIGQHFGRSHTTVLKGITCLEREMSKKTPGGRQIRYTLDRLATQGLSPA